MRRLFLAALLVCLLTAGFTTRGSTATRAGNVEGTALFTGKPVVGAVVSMDRQSVRSGADGKFAFAPLAVSGTHRLVDVTMRASGYSAWKLSRARGPPNDTLRITADLERLAVRITQPEPRTTDRTAGSPASLNVSQLAAASNTTLPRTIRVYVTGSATCNTSARGAVKVVDFKYYVKHVLPNEWLAGWPRESLRAGTMATKSYGWYQVNRGGKWSRLGADVMDSTCDQRYNPAVSYASTDQAVDATWSYRITRNGYVIPAYYWAGYRNDGSKPSTDRMTQWGSEYWARQGKIWTWILHYYYSNTVISRVSG